MDIFGTPSFLLLPHFSTRFFCTLHCSIRFNYISRSQSFLSCLYWSCRYWFQCYHVRKPYLTPRGARHPFHVHPENPIVTISILPSCEWGFLGNRVSLSLWYPVGSPVLSTVPFMRWTLSKHMFSYPSVPVGEFFQTPSQKPKSSDALIYLKCHGITLGITLIIPNSVLVVVLYCFRICNTSKLYFSKLNEEPMGFYKTKSF